MTHETKPLVATVIAVGLYYSPSFNGVEPTLFGQIRGLYHPKTGEKLKANPGGRSLFGKHFKPNVDKDILDTALRCAHYEFWVPKNDLLTREDFVQIEGEVETEFVINHVFYLNKLILPHQIGNAEGDGLLHIPLNQVDWYVRDGHLTEASITALAKCDLTNLWHMLSR